MNIKLYVLMKSINLNKNQMSTGDFMLLSVNDERLPKSPSDVYFLISLLTSLEAITKIKKGLYKLNKDKINTLIKTQEKENPYLEKSYNRGL